MASPLHPASKNGDCRGASADNDDVVLSSNRVDVLPCRPSTDGESRAVVIGSGTARLVCLVEGHASSQIADPDLETAISCGSTENVVASVLDDQTHVVLLCKLYGGGDIVNTGGVDCISRTVAYGTTASRRHLAGAGVDRWTSLMVRIVVAHGRVGLEGGIGVLIVDDGALSGVEEWAGI